MRSIHYLRNFTSTWTTETNTTKRCDRFTKSEVKDDFKYYVKNRNKSIEFETKMTCTKKSKMHINQAIVISINKKSNKICFRQCIWNGLLLVRFSKPSRCYWIGLCALVWILTRNLNWFCTNSNSKMEMHDENHRRTKSSWWTFSVWNRTGYFHPMNSNSASERMCFVSIEVT